MMWKARFDLTGLRVRPQLLWGFGLAGILSIGSLHWADDSSMSRHVVEPAVPHSNDSRIEMAAGPGIPAQLPRPDFSSNDSDVFDPFTGVKPPPLVPSAPAAAPVPTAPPIPATAYRLFGIVKDPQGNSHVYLTRGEGAVAVEGGMQLDDGYQIEAMTDEALTLRYGSSDARVVIPLRSSGMDR